MATVTGLTAERMLAIEAASVVDGDVIANHLILTRHDGVQIDAGSVVGPAGPTGPAGAAGFNVLTAAGILEPGISGQKRAGRVLTVADFTTLLGLSTPVGLFNLTALTNLGSGGALINKGVVTFGKGITGAVTEAAQFVGNVAQALYVVDTGAADPYRIPYGSVGCWFKSTKLGTQQLIICKSTASVTGFVFGVGGSGVPILQLTLNGTTWQTLVIGNTPVVDGRWHHLVFTYDGTYQQIYVDGVLDVVSPTVGGPIFHAASPLNIGGDGADAATNAVNPVYGSVDEAFITTDVLSEEQIRMLYAFKIAHGASFTPTGVSLAIRRLRKGAAIAQANFPTAPLRIYNFITGLLTDAGSAGSAVALSNAPTVGPSPDGIKDGAYFFKSASSQSITGSDTGLPATTTARSLGCWFKIEAGSTATYKALVGYGTAAGGAYYILYLGGAGSGQQGLLIAGAGGSAEVISTTRYDDGLWHHAVTVYDAAATDGLKHKLYVDGKLVAASVTALTVSTTLGGAGRFLIGQDPAGAAGYFNGLISRVFVTNYAMTSDDVAAVYAVGSLSLGASPKNGGDHVERIDATNVYFIGDALDSQNQIDLQVSA